MVEELDEPNTQHYNHELNWSVPSIAPMICHKIFEVYLIKIMGAFLNSELNSKVLKSALMQRFQEVS